MYLRYPFLPSKHPFPYPHYWLFSTTWNGNPKSSLPYKHPKDLYFLGNKSPENQNNTQFLYWKLLHKFPINEMTCKCNAIFYQLQKTFTSIQSLQFYCYHCPCHIDLQHCHVWNYCCSLVEFQNMWWAV